MISAADAIRIGRSLLGVRYGSGSGELDCINFVKKIVRVAPGGDPKYQTAGTNALWRSRDLSGKNESTACTVPGMLVFKHRASGREPAYYQGDGIGDVYHIGLATDTGTVLHSSSAKGMVVETALDNSWQYSAIHRLITPASNPGTGGGTMNEKMVVTTQNGGNVNLRTGPGTGNSVIAKIPTGTEVEVTLSLDDWKFVTVMGKQGYMASEYLKPADITPTDDPADGDDLPKMTTLRNLDGVFITLMGEWDVVSD